MRISRIAPSKESPSKQEDFSLVREKIIKYKGKKGATIPVLQGIQGVFGYLPFNIMKEASEEMGLPLSEMYGVATFYAQFRFSPVGKHIIKVCHGTACHVQNANAITEALEENLDIRDGETTPDGLFTLESVACLGCCSLAPVMMIGKETFGKLTGSSCSKIIKDIRAQENN
jgi:NADH-quinone oxidoreductase subunit E